MDNKEKFIDLFNLNVQRQGATELLEWLEQTDFFEAPASTRYHENFPGGLVAHSLNVYYQLDKLCDTFADVIDVPRETRVITALLHDICKVGCYKIGYRWRKNEQQQWEQYETYQFEEDFKFGGHGAKSVYLAQHFMPLTPEEASAINCHMGVENGRWEVLDTFRQNPLAFLLHTADMASTIDVLKIKEEM